MSKIQPVIEYLKYLLRHKWYVFVKCIQHGLLWRGIVHDLSKFLPSEFTSYVEHFHGKHAVRPSVGADKIGYCKPEVTSDCSFEWAWFRHQRRNDHHWQWWVCITSKGRHIPMPMSSKARLEMICDWHGAGMAQGDPDIRGWYERNKEGMLLHPETRAWVEQNL